MRLDLFGGPSGPVNVQLGLRVVAGDITAGDFFYYVPIPDGYAATYCEAWTDQGTVDVNIEQRANPTVAGTPILTADLTADDTGANTSALDVTDLTAGSYLVLTMANVAGAPNVLQVFLRIQASPQ